MPSHYQAEAGAVKVDHRTRLAIEREERAEQKRRELEQQCSELNSPQVRVQAWEKAHDLRLPGDATHPILYVIAQATRLTLTEVRAEQQARAGGCGRVGTP
jgi:hypothetical protein